MGGRIASPLLPTKPTPRTITPTTDASGKELFSQQRQGGEEKSSLRDQITCGAPPKRPLKSFGSSAAKVKAEQDAKVGGAGGVEKDSKKSVFLSLVEEKDGLFPLHFSASLTVRDRL